MADYEITLMQSFDLVECCACGVAFGIPTRLYKSLKETHVNFYCPNGHIQRFTGTTEAEQLRKQLIARNGELENARRALVAASEEAKKLAKEKARIEKRVSAGVCPCCNRTFENLARHMKTKHKDMPAAIAAAPARKLLQ